MNVKCVLLSLFDDDFITLIFHVHQCLTPKKHAYFGEKWNAACST